MAIRPTLKRAVAKAKSKASDYNYNFDEMMDFIDASIGESKDYVDGFMPSVIGHSGKFLTNNGTTTSWASLGDQPFGDFINGLIITKVDDDTIQVSAGRCYDSTKLKLLTLATDTTKQQTISAADLTYYVYIIASSDLSTVDIKITDDADTSLPETGYTYFRQLGYFKTISIVEEVEGEEVTSYVIGNIYTYGVNSNGSQANGVIVETYNNGSDWYRVYSDGWCEQGGHFYYTTAAWKEIAFLKPFINDKYNLQVTMVTTTSTAYGNALSGLSVAPIDKNKDGFKLYGYGSYDQLQNKDWFACGYIN